MYGKLEGQKATPQVFLIVREILKLKNRKLLSRKPAWYETVDGKMQTAHPESIPKISKSIS